MKRLIDKPFPGHPLVGAQIDIFRNKTLVKKEEITENADKNFMSFLDSFVEFTFFQKSPWNLSFSF